MANRHYAEIGDVWKHLPLGEILVIEAPTRYVETHAGSASYPLTPTWEREYGALYFLEHCESVPALAGSRYAGLLRDLAAPERDPPLYPGSPYLALSLLARAAHEFVFCDLDVESLETIRDTARELRLPEQKVHCLHGEGIAAVERLVADLDEPDRQGTFVHIDGYRPFEALGDAPSCIELFCRIAGLGVGVMMWYGFHSDPAPGHIGRHDCHEAIRSHLARTGLGGGGSSSPWTAEIWLEAMGRPGFDAVNPGVHGCGILCANLQSAARDRCARLVADLARIYHGARLPGDWSGALRFEVIRF
jgi:23S rRNA A2030 N6-methylase RlmJ